MDSYIVRIYRREGAPGEEVAGLVEEVGSEDKHAFKTLSGLMTTVRQVIGHDVEPSGRTNRLKDR